MTRPTALNRFESRLSEAGSCWIWTGYKDTHGYAAMKIGSRKVLMHRWSYEYHVADIPDGLQLDHLCRVRDCVNPEHLEPVTNRVNSLRGNSPVARQASQTHCKRGHEFTEANTYRWRNKRYCRTCVTARKAARRRGGAS